MDNSRTKVDVLDVDKLKTVGLEKLRDVVDNEVVKSTKFNTLNTTVDSLENNTPNGTSLIHINPYNKEKQNLEKKQLEIVIKKIPDTNGLVTTTVLHPKISEVENKIPNTSSLGSTTVLNTKISEVENKIPDNSEYITTQEFNKLTAVNFATRLKQVDLVKKETGFDNKLTTFNKRISLKKAKYLEVQKKKKKKKN